MKQKKLREDAIHIKMREIAEGVSLVREHLPKTAQEFGNLGLVRDGIYKRIEFAVEDVFDICAIINSDLVLGMPIEDDDILEHLVNNDIISKALYRKIQGMKGFRNIVVHRYGTIDDALAFRLLTENIGDFTEFLDEVEGILKKHR
ncbi:MAG: DUF86 domain-containing protein [Methanomicrobiales archaeon HGW-Methanomicrobiales-3]|jgi:uncharacterized protein YutE (UPF0331/DUF86 family)|nr:MAG: DUF86 domain-containing protein [Methanomicrobiales archaeon HGW-Methanomicrobiales-3]